MADRRREQGPNFRNTPRWQRLRALVLAEEPCCRLCTERGIEGIVATQLDHIKAVVLGGDRWKRENLQGLCVDCHKAKSAVEQQIHRRPKSITCKHGTTADNECPDCAQEGLANSPNSSLAFSQ